jgi:hypothetical protein
MYQTAIRNTKWLSNIPNGHRIYQHFTFQGPPKYTQIAIFGLKRNHLATLNLGTLTKKPDLTQLNLMYVGYPLTPEEGGHLTHSGDFLERSNEVDIFRHFDGRKFGCRNWNVVPKVQELVQRSERTTPAL